MLVVINIIITPYCANGCNIYIVYMNNKKLCILPQHLLTEACQHHVVPVEGF